MSSVIKRLGHKLPGPIKLEIHRAASVFNFLINKGAVKTPDGQVYDVPPNFSPSDYRALQRGDYERPEIDVLRKFFVPERGTIIDVGANIGVVGRYAIATKLKPGGTYIAVEPNPNSFKALDANMDRARQQFPDRDIRVVKAAVGDPAKEGTYADFFARPNLGSGLTSALKTVGRETTVRVPMTSLSRIIKNSPQGRPISLICDAEGAELTMLYKDPGALMRMHQIAIELHGPKITGKRETPEDMVDLLAALGFRREGIINSTHYFRQTLDRA